MDQRIVNDFPPNYEEIRKAFPAIRGKNILFSYGETLYNPGGVFVPKFILIHERLHGSRQIKDVEGWWKRYIEDPQFRLEEELLAHYAEQRFRLLRAHNRKERREIMAQTAKRLASPIYGPVVSKKKAVKLLDFLDNA